MPRCIKIPTRGHFTAATSTNRPSTFAGNGSNQFTLSKTWSAELSGFYDSGGTYGQFVTLPKGMLNAAIQKKILNNKGSIKLNVRDMLHSFSPSGTITNIAGANATFHNSLDTRVATLAFTYSFGNIDQCAPKTRYRRR